MPKLVPTSTLKNQATQEAKHEHPARQKEKSPAAKPSPEKETVPKEPELSKRGERYARRRRGLSPDIYSTQYYKSTADEGALHTHFNEDRNIHFFPKKGRLIVNNPKDFNGFLKTYF